MSNLVRTFFNVRLHGVGQSPRYLESHYFHKYFSKNLGISVIRTRQLEDANTCHGILVLNKHGLFTSQYCTLLPRPDKIVNMASGVPV